MASTPRRQDLQARLKPLIRKTQPYEQDRARGIWVEPELLAEIEYRAKSAEGKVRHPFLRDYARTCEGLGLWRRELLSRTTEQTSRFTAAGQTNSIAAQTKATSAAWV